MAWKKWKDVAGLLTNRNVPLKSRGYIYKACIRPVLLYGVETWSMTRNIELNLQACDRRMLRYMSGISLADRVRSEDIERNCGVKSLLVTVRENRLRWFGHVKRREGRGVLGEVMNLQVPGTRPRGRPKKTWTKNIEEDLNEMGLVEDDAMDRDKWRAIIKTSNPLNRRRRR